MWRIHLTTEDIRRIRIAPDIDPLWELVHSIQLLDNGGPVIFGPWRRRVRLAGLARWSMLRHLSPPMGYFADFLTPATGTTDLRTGIEEVLRTPRSSLRSDLVTLHEQCPRAVGWARDLAAGDQQALRALGSNLIQFHETHLKPSWAEIRGQVTEELTRVRRILCDEGVDALLASLGGHVHWESPALVLRNKTTDRDLYVDGRGIIIQPSFFALGDTSILDVPGEPFVLAYPVRHRLGWWDTNTEGIRLDAVLGKTRAEVLECLASSPHTTTELARALDLSSASVSEQAKALREAGLITSRRTGKRVLHDLSPTGSTLLGHRVG
ncbi:ArsR family transcriptional regulator [Kribbella antibiotica]|uniref:ArsR family transcriptional regulator n=1 Tax=Kribbella antibiotica TaxID=190195 RepID=A0A4R4ZH44_9ACTN|nr:winged helix-turn-helix domain-containing protein [Kribbella antibiotica]TDD57725.1 ArsR family transcriptional regulator [Kribbella antibiotica]